MTVKRHKPKELKRTGWLHPSNGPLDNGTLIVSCKFKQADTADSGGNVQVWVTYSTGVEEKLFAYFSDELSFDALEFVGKSKQEALDFRHKRDVEYLQAP